MCGVGFIADLHGSSSRPLPLALRSLTALAHRGGDGAGVMIDIPRTLLGMNEGDAAGMIFGSPQPLERTLDRLGLAVAGQRCVPTGFPIENQPPITQLIVARPCGMNDQEFERRLTRARRECRDDGVYVVSLSTRTIVYKALVTAPDLAAFYPDLQDPTIETSFALFHNRFSTNTLPSWPMTQPFRLLGHNGEINTITGNRSDMRARGYELTLAASDSASLDEALELASDNADVTEAMRGLLGTWEGPAMVAFSDGRRAGAALDNNGLRPARYSITGDGLVVVASEMLEMENVIEKGRLRPGGVLTVDLRSGRVC